MSIFFKKISLCLPSSPKKKTKPQGPIRKGEVTNEDLTKASIYTRNIGDYALDEPSEILSETQIHLLEQQLPPISRGSRWNKLFSTSKNGFTLHSLYRKMRSLNNNDLPVLLVIQDTNSHIFGVFASNPLKVTDTFYGLGSTFLFRFTPLLQVFKWNGDNFYFIKGDLNSITFGSDNGKPGLWLDGDLNNGRTEECTTFRSPPLVSENNGDFTVQSVEAWTFGW